VAGVRISLSPQTHRERVVREPKKKARFPHPRVADQKQLELVRAVGKVSHLWLKAREAMCDVRNFSWRNFCK
jgi:hypothetical protein